VNRRNPGEGAEVQLGCGERREGFRLIGSGDTQQGAIWTGKRALSPVPGGEGVAGGGEKGSLCGASTYGKTDFPGQKPDARKKLKRQIGLPQQGKGEKELREKRPHSSM